MGGLSGREIAGAGCGGTAMMDSAGPGEVGTGEHGQRGAWGSGPGDGGRRRLRPARLTAREPSHAHAVRTSVRIEHHQPGLKDRHPSATDLASRTDSPSTTSTIDTICLKRQLFHRPTSAINLTSRTASPSTHERGADGVGSGGQGPVAGDAAGGPGLARSRPLVRPPPRDRLGDRTTLLQGEMGRRARALVGPASRGAASPPAPVPRPRPRRHPGPRCPRSPRRTRG